ncbi:OLC1v1033131C2 [Oldenlandia corymbosa var. corymbosa]|nr:OLC1v1033131C2 [Oldenlandia corymbosa var. corymbosa]
MTELRKSTRVRVLEFLIHCAHELEVSPMVKYSALSLFAERFYPSISGLLENKATEHWLLHPMTEGNLQLFALSALWISSKMHDSPPLSVKHCKNLANKYIREQHFTLRDLLESVSEFRIGTLNIAFVFLEELLVQLREVAQVGEHVRLETCMDIFDLLYEEEEKMILYNSPFSLAASLLVVAYVVTVPKRKWEFPILPWVKFVTGCKEEDILTCVEDILKHVVCNVNMTST